VIGRFRRDATEIGEARRLVRSSLRSWGLAEEAPTFELAVSELVTNALVHGEGMVEVTLTATGTSVRLEVLDQGQDAVTPRVRQVSAGEAGRWGLRLLDELSDAWGAVTSPTETRVWMEMDVAQRRTSHELPDSSHRTGWAGTTAEWDRGAPTG
jgi:anti-sigma regulatory factor (Ser/Thr protein kinase)